MKIALITDGIWPYVLGGMQKHSYYLCKYLAREKVQVDLFHFNQSNYDIGRLEFFSEEEKKYIRATVVPFPDTAQGFGHYLINSYRYSLDVYEQLKNNLEDYDLIYAKGFTGWHFVREKHRSSTKFPPIAVKFHGYEMFQKAPDFKSFLQQKLLLQKPVKEISQKADLVFSYGGKITEIIKNIGVNADKIIELPSGVEGSMLAKEIHPTGTVKKFLFLGRYERRKGIAELSKALQKLKGQNFEFHFIGPIPDEKKVGASNIIYHGEIRDKHLLNESIRNCDILICPSWSEGLPNVILEAMAAGLAVIATDVGATRLLVNDKTGWLLKDGSAATITEALKQAIALPAGETDHRKKAALELIKADFTWEKLIKQFLDKLKQRI